MDPPGRVLACIFSPDSLNPHAKAKCCICELSLQVLRPVRGGAWSARASGAVQGLPRLRACEPPELSMSGQWLQSCQHLGNGSRGGNIRGMALE